MKIILASKSVRKDLDKHNINNEVIVSNVDEDEVKKSLAEGANFISVEKFSRDQIYQSIPSILID